jgi:hypothetical protein
MISSKNERVFIRDLSDLTLQIIFDAWWASMNVGSRWPIAWKNSRQRLHGDSIYTVELRRPAALASYVSFVIKFFAIHQNMGPAQWGNTYWQKLTSQS